MNKILLSFMLILLVVNVFADETLNGGTTSEELKKQAFTQPSSIKVAVMPFFDYASNIQHQHLASAASYMLLGYHGFDSIPLQATYDAAGKDKELEPGIAMRKQDAVRIGNCLKADWVVYGEVNEIRTYMKKKFFGERRKIQASMRICVADCHTGELIYWCNRADSMGDIPGVERKASKLIRVAIQSITKYSFESLIKALPEHKTVGPEPNDKMLLDLEKSIWPDSK